MTPVLESDRDDEFTRKLLAPIARVQPVTLTNCPAQLRGRHLRSILVAAGMLAALAGAGVAIAAGLGAFNGINAAQHPQSSTDVLDKSDLPPNCDSGSPAADSP